MTMEEKKRVRWCRTAPADALRLLGSDGQRGLSHKEAYRRLRANGQNRFMEPPKQALGILRGLFRDPVLILTLLCGVLSLCFGEVLSGLPFLVLFLAWGTVFVVRLLRQVWRLQAQFAFFDTPSVTVMREGEAFLIPGTRVVRGDVIVLHEGDIVPCDCRLLSGEDLTVRLTWREGEKPAPHLYKKNAGRTYAYGDATLPPNEENMLYGGSVIVSGSAVALAVELGDTSFLGAMGEKYRSFGKPTGGEAMGGVLPYCKLFSFVSLLLLFLCGIVSLFAAPAEYTALRVFLPVCVITASASVGVTGLYFTALLSRNRLAAGRAKDPRARVWIRSSVANETLPYLTDLFVVGRAAFSDGRQHLCSGCTADGVFADGAELTGLAEAFVLLAKAREALPAARCDRFTEPEDMTYLGELLRAAKPDLHALDIRLRSVNLIAAGEEDLLHVVTGTETYRLHLSHGIAAISGCTGLYTAQGVVPMTPVRWETLLRYCEGEETRHRHIRTVVKETQGQRLLVGLLSLGEAFLPDLEGEFEKLARAGVRVSVFSDLDAEESARYFRACCPSLPVEDAAAFSEETGQPVRIFAGASHSTVAGYLRDLKKNGRTAALLCNRTDSRQLLGTAALRVVADDCFGLLSENGGGMPERIPLRELQSGDICYQSMRDGADLVLSRAGASGGGIAALEPVLRRSRVMTWRLRALLRNLTLLKLTRMVFFTLCVLSGMGPPTAAEVFFACFGGDLAALWAAMHGKVQHAGDEVFRPDYGSLMRFFRDRTLWLPALIPPVAAWVLSLALRVTGLLSAGAAQSLPAIGLAVFQVVLLIFAESEDVRMRGSGDYAKLAAALLLPLLPVILLSVLVSPVGSVTGLGTWSAASVAMALLTVLAGLIGTLPLTHKNRK